MYLHRQAIEDARTLCSQLLKIITKQTNETTLVNRCGVVRRIGRSGLLTKEPLPDDCLFAKFIDNAPVLCM